MLGSYGPHPQGKAYTKDFSPEESPSGMIARSGTFGVRSRVIDDDGEVYAGMFNLSQIWRLTNHAALRLAVAVQVGEGLVVICDSATLDDEWIPPGPHGNDMYESTRLSLCKYQTNCVKILVE